MKDTDPKCFEVFKEAATLWQKHLGLTDWSIYFLFRQLRGAYASCTFNTEGMTATLTLNSKYHPDFPIDEDEARRSALHEVLELLLAPMWDMMLEREFIKRDGEQARHAIIRRLENFLIPNDK
jgi:hypothetical protein